MTQNGRPLDLPPVKHPSEITTYLTKNVLLTTKTSMTNHLFRHHVQHGISNERWQLCRVPFWAWLCKSEGTMAPTHHPLPDSHWHTRRQGCKVRLERGRLGPFNAVTCLDKSWGPNTNILDGGR